MSKSKRMVELSRENDDLSDDIGKLEAALQLHKDLSAQRTSSAKNTIRKGAGGAIWQFGGKGKLNNFKSKKDITKSSSNGVNMPSSQPVFSAASTVRTRPVSASRRKRINTDPTQTPDLVSDENSAQFHSSDDKDIMGEPAVHKDNGGGDMNEKSPSTAVGRMPARHAQSHSASGLKHNRNRKPPSNKPATKLSATGESLVVAERTSPRRSEEDGQDRLLNIPDFQEQAYSEKVAVMKNKVLKRMLGKVDVETKLKDFKRSIRVASDGSQGSQRSTSEPTVITYDSTENVARDGDTGSCVDPDSSGEGETEPEKKPPVIQLDPGLEAWLKVNSLYSNERLKAIFRKRQVTMARLKNMTDSRLRSLGITNATTLNKLRRALIQLKVEAIQSARAPQDPPTRDIDDAEPQAKQEESKSPSPTPEKEIITEGQSILNGKNERSKTRSKSVDSKGKVPYMKQAWGSRPSRSKVRTRVSAADAPAPRMRPSSAAISRRQESQRTSATPRPRTGLTFRTPRIKGMSSDEPDDPAEVKDAENVDIIVIKRSPRDVRQRMALGLTDLQVTGSLIGNPTSARRQADTELRATGRVRGRSCSPTGGAARSALETMEQQIQILKRRASTTGDSETAAMIAQLQTQLLQVQRVITSKPPGGDTGTAPLSGVPSGDAKLPPPGVQSEQGSFMKAALAGNVRPLSCRKNRSDNMEADEHDGRPADDHSRDAAPSESSSRPPTSKRTATGSGFRGKLAPGGATPLSMSMSKQAILKEVRKKTEEHRRTVKHLESELSRLKHKDPLRSSEVAEEDVAYSESGLIGEGAFSEVFHGMFQGAEVAVKRLKVPLTSQDKNYFIAEVNLLRELRHPRVVLLMGVCTTAQHPLMVLEFLSGGNLYGYLHDDNRPSLDHAAFYQIAQDVAVGMNYLHRHRPAVLHLDLKSLNVLLTAHLRAKIADFGFSKLRHDAELSASQRTGGVKGTPAWMAPELLNTGDITTKADVFSYGILLWEMLTRERPYKGCSMFQVIERVRNNQRPELPEACPGKLADLITACWHHSVTKRPSFQEVLVQLDELHFPAEWKTLFAAAGLPQVALDDIEATRTIIDIVSHTVQNGFGPESEVPTTENPAPAYRDAPAPSRGPVGIPAVTAHAPAAVGRKEGRFARKGGSPSRKTEGKLVDAKTTARKGIAESKSATSTAPPPAPPLPPPTMAAPPPPPPRPPPPMASQTAAPSSVNFMGQLKANLQDIKLKSPGKLAVHGPHGDPRVAARAGGGPGGGAGGFAIQAAELQSKRQELRPTAGRPHPNELQDLSAVGPGAISGIADVLRRAVNERRLALNEGNSVEWSQAYTDSGWSVG